MHTSRLGTLPGELVKYTSLLKSHCLSDSCSALVVVVVVVVVMVVVVAAVVVVVVVVDVVVVISGLVNEIALAAALVFVHAVATWLQNLLW
mgnify:CR=1 FL=1